MIKFSGTAKIHSIGEIQNISANFRKVEVILDDSFTKDGNTFTSFVKIELVNAHIDQLRGMQPGQLVTVEGFINGREYNGKYYNNERCAIIVPYVSQQTQQPQTQQQPAPIPKPVNPMNAVQPDLFGKPNGTPAKPDDLPF